MPKHMPGGSPSCWMPPSWRPTAHYRRGPTSWPSAATSSTRRWCGRLIGPREVFERGDPFLAGGGAVDLVDLDEVIWTDPPEREEAGSPNVIGAVAFGQAMDDLERIGWETITAHEQVLATRLYDGLRSIDGVRCSARGPNPATTTGSPWRRSRWTECTTPWWRPG